MIFENRGKAYDAHVLSTTKGGTTRSMDSGSSKKAQLHTTISMKRNAVNYSSE
jgi:hypothetical protein